MSDSYIKEVSLTQIENLLKAFPPAIENLGEGLYRLPGGIITGEKGLLLFDEEVMKTISRK